jgi:hypothetical protein
MTDLVENFIEDFTEWYGEELNFADHGEIISELYAEIDAAVEKANAAIEKIKAG